MKESLDLLIKLQEADKRIQEKRVFIDKVPRRIYEVDEPFKHAQEDLEKIKQKNETLAKKKSQQESHLEEINEKVNKMKSRVSDIKTNKEYQAHLKEIASFEKEIADREEKILLIMEDLDNSLKNQKEKEEKVNTEARKIDAFKKELDKEVELYEHELASSKEERDKIAGRLDPDLYIIYNTLLTTKDGIAVSRAQDEMCLGCNMNVPPQLFVEIKKNEDILQCPQCRRILYYSEAL